MAPLVLTKIDRDEFVLALAIVRVITGVIGNDTHEVQDTVTRPVTPIQPPLQYGCQTDRASPDVI